MKSSVLTIGTVVALLALAAPASAQEANTKAVYETGGLAEIGLVAGAKLGGGFSQVYSELGTSFVGELELGYLLPVLDRSLQVWVSGQYAAPSAEGEAPADARLPEPGVMTYTVTHNQLVLGTGLLYRLPLETTMLRPYASLGGRAYFTRTDVIGEAGGEPFGMNQETATDFGFFAALGAEYYLGPGGLLFELQTGYTAVDSYIMRDTNAGSLNLMIGYRIFI